MQMKPNREYTFDRPTAYDPIAELGFNHMVTRNLDRLVNRGTVFENMFITSPSCAPSRASLFRGTYPHTNGVYRDDEPWQHCWVKDLAETGYRTVNVGKMHTMPVEGAFGIHERHATENKDRDHPSLPFYLDNWDKAFFLSGIEKPSRVTQRRNVDLGEKLGVWVWEYDEFMHPDFFTGQMAKWWIDRYTDKRSFFLRIGIPGPHTLFDPTQEFLDLYKHRDLPNVIPPDLNAQPKAMQDLRRFHLEDDADGIVHLENPTAEQSRQQRMHYYANVSMIDRQFGEIIDALELRGVPDNTIIAFTSDHGHAIGDHGHSQKWNMYQSTVQVLALVAGPCISSGKRITDNVLLFDLAPSILEWAEVEVPHWMEAESLLPYLKDGPSLERKLVFAEHSNDALLQGIQMMTMVLGGKMKLVNFIDSDSGMLFDLQIEPREENNLWDDPMHRITRERLIYEILIWRAECALKAQGIVEACARGAPSLMSPPAHIVRGLHHEVSREKWGDCC